MSYTLRCCSGKPARLCPLALFLTPPQLHWCQWKNNKVVNTIGTDAMKKVVFCKLIIQANNVIAVVLLLTRFNGLHLIPKGAYMTSFIKVPWKKQRKKIIGWRKFFWFFSDLNAGLYAGTPEISSLLSITTFVPSLCGHSMGLTLLPYFYQYKEVWGFSI